MKSISIISLTLITKENRALPQTLSDIMAEESYPPSSTHHLGASPR
jgi:hypothetical protein